MFASQNAKVLYKMSKCFSKSKCAFQNALMLFDTFSKRISNMYLELKFVNVKGLKLKLKDIEYF